MTVDHEGLRAVEPETVGVSGGGKRDAARLVLGAFVDRQRGDELAGGDARQMLGFVLGGAGEPDGARGDDRGREERGGGERAPHFLEQHAGLDIAEPDAAELLGDQHAGPAHFGEPVPQRAGKAGAVAFIAQLAQMRDRSLLGEIAARALAQHLLLVGKDQRHQLPSRWVIPAECEA